MTEHDTAPPPSPASAVDAGADADAARARAALLAVRAEVAKAVVGQDAAVAGLLVALLCRGHILLESYYPLPWMLGDFTALGYYKKDEPPEVYDADFVVAEVSQMEKIEAGLKGEYYKRRFRLRDSQEECVAYFNKQTFEEWFGGAPPVFQGER